MIDIYSSVDDWMVMTVLKEKVHISRLSDEDVRDHSLTMRAGGLENGGGGVHKIPLSFINLCLCKSPLTVMPMDILFTHVKSSIPYLQNLDWTLGQVQKK